MCAAPSTSNPSLPHPHPHLLQVVLVVLLLKELVGASHRVLVFSQSRVMLDLLEVSHERGQGGGEREREGGGVGWGGRGGGRAGLLDVNWRGLSWPILVFGPPTQHLCALPFPGALCPLRRPYTHVHRFTSLHISNSPPIPASRLPQACVRGAGHTYCRIDGTSSLEERRGQVEAFQAPRSNIQVFLLTSQVRGWCGLAWGAVICTMGGFQLRCCQVILLCVRLGTTCLPPFTPHSSPPSHPLLLRTHAPRWVAWGSRSQGRTVW